MGACYSKQGHNATLSPKHRSNPPKHHKNGGVPIKIEYTPVRPQEDDRISILHKDDLNSSPEGPDLVTTDKVESDYEDKGGVAPSDSGIESLAANDNVIGHSDNISSHSPERECSPSPHQCDLNKDQTGETYCTCGPRGACKQQWNLNHGECKTHINTSQFQPKRNSEIIILKPSLKRKGQKSERNLRLSWKSTDSLDWTGTFVTCMDRSRSEVSDIFCDDISICAPLAQFDSIDFLGSTGLLSNKSRDSLVDYKSDTFQFQFDFSGLDPKVDKTGDTAPSTTTEAGSKQPRHNSAGSISLENVSVEVPISAKRLSQEIRRFDSEASLDLSSSVSSMHEVRTMNLNGKEVVVIELETYCQIMDEIDFLKMKLSQLTDLIQEQDLSPTDSCKTRSPSVTSS